MCAEEVGHAHTCAFYTFFKNIPFEPIDYNTDISTGGVE